MEEEINNKFKEITTQKEMITKALEQKRKQADVFANKLNIKKKIQQISDQVKREVLKIREDLRARMLSKKRDLQRKKELMLMKIEDVKHGISDDLIRASKSGNSEECDPERATAQIIQYCKVNFQFNYSKMNDCIKSDKFCYKCCESEFGDLHIEQRSTCFAKCDDYYIYKVKFKHIHPLKMAVEVTPYGVKSTEIKELKQETMDPPSLQNEMNSSLNSFVEKKSQRCENSSCDKSADIQDLIEQTKKTELLKLIKEDLNDI
jgi:hypothetical protein